MNQYTVFPSAIYGEANVPSSKSQTLRAILFASLTKGTSIIYNYLDSPDSRAMIQGCRLLGARIQQNSNSLIIKGHSPILTKHTRIDAQESGICFRFLTALAATSCYPVMITGKSTLHRRPILPLLQALGNLGATYTSPPIPFTISGPLRANHTLLSGSDSQYASALAIACSISKEPSSFTIDTLKEKPWWEMTLHWLKFTGLPYRQIGNTYSFPGNFRPNPFSYTVSGDFSSAAFLAAAALLSNSPYPTRLKQLDFSDVQGDKALFYLLQKLGANLVIGTDYLVIYPSNFLGGTIDMDPFIDALPILTVLSCFAKSPSYLYNAGGARYKESDRITAISQELRKMGANIKETHDGLYIIPSKLHGAELFSHHDHRIAMALTVAAMQATSPSRINATQCIHKTFPNWITILNQLHAHVDCSPFSLWPSYCR